MTGFAVGFLVGNGVLIAMGALAYFLVTRRRLRLFLLVDHLAAIARRNLPLQTGLRMLAHDMGGFLGTRLDHAAHLLEQGRPPSEAFGASPHTFPRLLRNFMRLGERSGNFAAFLQDLRESYRRVVRFHYESTYVLLYPVALTLFVTAGVAAHAFLAPRFGDVFDSVGVSYDRGIWTLLAVCAQAVLAAAVALALGIVAGGLPAHAGLSPLRFARRAIDRLVLVLPGLRRWALDLSLRQVSVTIAQFLRAGGTLAEAVRAASELEINAVLAVRLEALARHIEEGGRMSEWCRRERLIPADFAWFVEAGEAAGDLGGHMLRATEHFESRAAFAGHVLARSIIPVFVLLNGALVLGIMCAVFVPIRGMWEAIPLP